MRLQESIIRLQILYLEESDLYLLFCELICSCSSGTASESLSTATGAAFYRKRVSKDFNASEDSIIVRMLQSFAVPVLGNVFHVFMNGLNRVQVYGLENLHDALLHRPKGKPLRTVSNHVASVDDPFVIASLLPPKCTFGCEEPEMDTLCN
ncbi:hypothetical protein L6164_035010 [Bauhinia variegata]|uniref:Uncharacterized protein n=1 Tax=Bauhinia variegata TaxID=167791 RepID=A0ACB9KX95_BAUVA|nr:hypothetical protein L6164_035010 [Bauhinia variegata]